MMNQMLIYANCQFLFSIYGHNLKAANSFKHIQEMMQRAFLCSEVKWTGPFFSSRSIVFCVKSFFCLFFCLVFFLFYVFIIFGTFLWKFQLLFFSILSLFSEINVRLSSQTFSPCVHSPFHWQMCIVTVKVALPLLCRCQVLQTKICCAIIYDQRYIYFLFSSSSNASFGASLCHFIFTFVGREQCSVSDYKVACF